jgi:hypothetical protein
MVRTACRAAVGLVVVLAVLALAAPGGVGQATDRDELIVTVQVSSAEHEAQEGYFSLGEDATLMVKPGSDLFKFLSRHRGRTLRVVLTDASRPELSRLER